MEETTQDTSRKRKQSRIIDSFVAQCGKCDKWRSIESQEEYEEIRSEALNKPFECKNSCEEPEDVVEHDSTRLWLLDNHYGLPKTPQGLKRIVVLRERGDATDVYYLTPQGKRLRSTREVASFIQDNESFKDTNIEDISFAKPKVMKKKTEFEDVDAAKTKDKNKKAKRGSPKKKSQVSDVETSARADDETNKDSVEVSDEDNDQKLQVLSVEIPLPLENGEPSEKTPEAETHNHETPDKSEEKTLPDVEVSPAQKGCNILSKKTMFRDVDAAKTKDKNKNGKRGSPKKKSQISDDETSTRADDFTKKDSVEVSDEDNNQKLQEVLSVEIPSPLENGEPSEKTSEAETHTHEAPDKSEEKTLRDIEVSFTQKGCDILSKEKQNKESVVINSDNEEEKDMPESLQNEKKATDNEEKTLRDDEVSPAQKGCDILSKAKQKKESVVMNSDNEEEKDMPESLQSEKQATDQEIQSPNDVLASHKGDATLSKKRRKKNRNKKTSKKKKQAIYGQGQECELVIREDLCFHHLSGTQRRD